MVYAVDVDNVICNLQEVVIDLFNKRHGTHYTIDDFHDYDVMNVLPVEEAIAMKAIYGERGLYNLVKPIVGAQDSLQKLINEGHQVYLITDAIPNTYGEKVDFIKRYFPFINDAHIIAMKHKHLFRCDVMIEDNLTNLLAKPFYYRICFDYPWNRNTRDHVYDIHRCSNWGQVMDTANKINNMESDYIGCN